MRRWLLLIAVIALLPFAAPVFVLAQVSSSQSELKYSRSLGLGMTGSDVKMLQQLLSRIPNTYQESATGYFGKLTEGAVKRFQEREGIATSGKPGYGQAGPKTVAKINEVIRRMETSSLPKAAAESAPSAAMNSMATNMPSLSTSTAATASNATSTSSASTSSASAKPAADTTPPVRANGSPGNVLPMDSKKITISLTTNEAARCYWSNVPNTAFDYMATALTPSSNGMSHSYLLSLPMVPMGDYAFFVRCRDSNMNVNKTDYPILFSVQHIESKDRSPPRVVMSSPTDGDSAATGVITLTTAASDNAGVSGVRFFLNSQDLNFEDPSSPYSISVMLSPGSYRAFAVARDTVGNRATSTEITFSVTAKATSSASRAAPSSVNLASASYSFKNGFGRLISLFKGIFHR